MNWQTLFLSAEGRIGRKDFWIGFLILCVIWILSPILHVLAFLVWLALLYAWVCLFAKRLHDFGKSGMLILIPFAVGCVALVAALIFGGIGAISAIYNASQGGSEPANWAVLIGALGMALAFLCVAGLVKLVFILWVGLNPSDVGDNRYGPPPLAPVPPAPVAP